MPVVIFESLNSNKTIVSSLYDKRKAQLHCKNFTQALKRMKDVSGRSTVEIKLVR